MEVEESTYAPPGSSWSNKDLDPIPPERQTWRTYNFVTYWISDAFSISSWRIGASLISIGLSWKLALVAVVIGNFGTALVVTYNGLTGARLHVLFTVQARSAFGFYFLYVMIIFRVIVSIFWYGIGTYAGADCIRSTIYAWAPNFRNIPNHLPESANIDTGFMICYFIYFILVLPFHWIPAHQLHWFFTFKAIFTPIAGFAILGWEIHSTGGGDQVFQYGNSYSGSSLGWAFMSGVNAMIGHFATLGVNINDFARYSKKPNSPYIQLIVIPAVFIIMMLFGIIAANGTHIIYGEALWDPMLIVDNWTSPGGRVAAFFIALAFLIAGIGINISANSISVAVDLTTLFPRYLNLRRAQYVCAVSGAWAMCPWEILASAKSFLTFMDGYSFGLHPSLAFLYQTTGLSINKGHLSQILTGPMVICIREVGDELESSCRVCCRLRPVAHRICKGGYAFGCRIGWRIESLRAWLLLCFSDQLRALYCPEQDLSPEKRVHWTDDK